MNKIEALKLAHNMARLSPFVGKLGAAILRELTQDAFALAEQPEQEPWCMKMNGCKTKCEDCPDKPAQPEQEPLEYWNAVEGWVKIDEVREHFDSVGCGTIYKTAGEGREPLYTTPPQRTWVDVPDEGIKILWIQYRAALPRYLCFAKALLARAKEENT